MKTLPTEQIIHWMMTRFWSRREPAAQQHNKPNPIKLDLFLGLAKAIVMAGRGHRNDAIFTPN